MALSDLKPARGSVRNRKRVGRGPGSGLGKTSGRGEKGQKSRSGFSQKPGFEGGQMPLHRRVPKRGFSNARFKKEFTEINLGRLEIFEAGTIVTPEILVEPRHHQEAARRPEGARGRRPDQGPHRARPQVLGARVGEDHDPRRESRSHREGVGDEPNEERTGQ